MNPKIHFQQQKTQRKNLKSILTEQNWVLVKNKERKPVFIHCQQVDEETSHFLGIYYEVFIWLEADGNQDKQLFVSFVTSEKDFPDQNTYPLSQFLDKNIVSFGDYTLQKALSNK